MQVPLHCRRLQCGAGVARERTHEREVYGEPAQLRHERRPFVREETQRGYEAVGFLRLAAGAQLRVRRDERVGHLREQLHPAARRGLHSGENPQNVILLTRASISAL